MSRSAKRALIAVLAAVVTVASYAVRIQGGMVDFSVNYLAGQRLQAGETLYQTADGHYMFKYLPVSALIYLPLGHLPIDVAKGIWFAILIAALAWSFALIRELVPPPHRPYVLVVTAVVLAKYFLHELRLGQINILLMLVMLLAIRALSGAADERHEVAAGVLAGIATALKPYAAILFPYLLLRKKWAAVIAGIATLAISLLIPAIFYGVRGNIDVLREWAVTLRQSTPSLLANNDNVSVMAFFAKWLGASRLAVGASLIVLGVLAALMTAAVVRGNQRPGRSALEGAMLLTLIPLVSPMGWDYTFLISALAVALLVNSFDVFPRTAQVLLVANFTIIALAVFDLMGRQAYATFMQWSVTTVNFLIVFMALTYLRFRAEF